MTKQVAIGAAAFVAYFWSLYIGNRAGRGDSTQPDHVALQTRQDIGAIFSCLTVTNALLAAILAALAF
jgi:hypothetical protein